MRSKPFSQREVIKLGAWLDTTKEAFQKYPPTYTDLVREFGRVVGREVTKAQVAHFLRGMEDLGWRPRKTGGRTRESTARVDRVARATHEALQVLRRASGGLMGPDDRAIFQEACDRLQAVYQHRREEEA